MATNARSWAATASITGILLAGSAAPAHAADPVAWTMAPCVTVEAMQPALNTDHLYNVVEGTVSQCRPVVRAGGFRIATYRPDGATGFAPGYNVRLFGSTRAGKVSHFGVAALPTEEGVFGVCVLAGDNERVGCYRAEITRGEESYEDVLFPLPTDDPLVDKDVVTSPYTGSRFPSTGVIIGGQPACGTCF
jgi:hypothetical protein